MAFHGIVVSFEQGSVEWKEWRRNGIGSSDASVIEGSSPYKTPRQLFIDKQSGADEPVKFIFDRGHRLEVVIRDQFNASTGMDMQPVCFQHPEHAHLRASLDGFSSDGVILEAKHVGKTVLQEVQQSGIIPAHHYVQMQHQFGVVGVETGYWVGHDGQGSSHSQKVVADRDFIARLFAKEHTFWNAYLSGELPALSAMDALMLEDNPLLQKLAAAKSAYDAASKHYASARLAATAVCTHNRVQGSGLLLSQTTRLGQLDIATIPEVQAVLSKLSPEYLATFRKPDSTSWTVKAIAKDTSDETE
jgi:putative phage-type endonuclease